jgi:hypothetical protein
MFSPSAPEVPESHRAQGSVYMRYEDIAQDGALKVGGMPHAIGMVCFGQLWIPTQVNRETRPLGIVPILSRLVMQSTGGPVAVRHPIQVEGRYVLGHTTDPAGAINRLLLNMHCELHGQVARTHDPQPSNAGERVHVGRVFAEHVFTRPFGPPAARKVLSLPLSTGEHVPSDALSFRSASRTLDVPEDASWLEPELMLDAVPLAFGLTHTDSNQHVNSLVYPQLFEDAALRRLFDLGRDTRALLVDHIDIAFRKPCFAGQRMGLWIRAFEHQGKLGAIGYLGASDAKVESAHCLCLMTFREGELARG